MNLPIPIQDIIFSVSVGLFLYFFLSELDDAPYRFQISFVVSLILGFITWVSGISILGLLLVELKLVPFWLIWFPVCFTVYIGFLKGWRGAKSSLWGFVRESILTYGLVLLLFFTYRLF